MRTELFMALRYLFTRKKKNVINIISIISVAGVFAGTMGLIIVLSVFNGFSNLIVSLYDSFDPDIKITAQRGKTFHPSDLDTAWIQNIDGVKTISFSLDENALFKYRDRQFIGRIKGVDRNFTEVTNIRNSIIDGDLYFHNKGQDFAVAGSGVAYSLSLSLNDPFNAISVYIPKKGKPAPIINPEDAFNIRFIIPAGVFSLQQDFDTKYLLVPIEFAQDITGSGTSVGAAEIALKPDADPQMATGQLKSRFGNQFEVKSRVQQHEFLYKVLKTEKWAVYFILSIILIIAIFNISGSLNMLIIEKEKDIAILMAMGSTDKSVRRIFMFTGVLISLAGAAAGLLAGGFICWIQQQFGLIKLENAESFLIDAYPVAMEASDFFTVLLIVLCIGTAGAWYTARKISGTDVHMLLRSGK